MCIKLNNIKLKECEKMIHDKDLAVKASIHMNHHYSGIYGKEIYPVAFNPLSSSKKISRKIILVEYSK